MFGLEEDLYYKTEEMVKAGNNIAIALAKLSDGVDSPPISPGEIIELLLEWQTACEINPYE